MIFNVFTSVFSGVVVCIRQVLLPFSQDLDDLSRDKLVLEFQNISIVLMSSYPLRMSMHFSDGIRRYIIKFRSMKVEFSL